ncbi:hypothetical protein LTR36_005644 [Oleoguttula mirabilis]|uniref:Uncharacterized protein n=1 Tax=Oleoguttula mirabilis TaxID=1507867 RepID=A0AAV9JDV5_9PEZI|nr:hypothetical protein LTR36_005644 [Oleoguttula mirabilis]
MPPPTTFTHNGVMVARIWRGEHAGHGRRVIEHWLQVRGDRMPTEATSDSYKVATFDWRDDDPRIAAMFTVDISRLGIMGNEWIDHMVKSELKAAAREGYLIRREAQSFWTTYMDVWAVRVPTDRVVYRRDNGNVCVELSQLY